MQMTIKQLRSVIREEVDRCVRFSAGFAGGGIGAGAHRSGADDTQPILGDEDKDDNDKEEQATTINRKFDGRFKGRQS